MASKKSYDEKAAATDQPLEAGTEDSQKKSEEEQAQGFRGVRTDPTPHENYTVPGVLAGKPTPETDDKAASKAAEASS